MIGLDIWFTQFGVRTQKLCKLQVPDYCCAEAAGRPASPRPAGRPDSFAKHIIPCHKTTRDPPMDSYAPDIQTNTKDMIERPSTWIKGPIYSTLTRSTTMDFVHPLIKMSVKREAETCQTQVGRPTNFSFKPTQPSTSI